MKRSRPLPGQQSSLSWYLRRFRSMPLAEIPHRVRESFYKQLFRISSIAQRDSRLPEGQVDRHLPSLPLHLGTLKAALSETELARLSTDVDRLCEGRVDLLGQQWVGPATRDWSLDPESGEHWQSEQYTFSIPRRSGQGPGDVKFAWELSRLQHLQTLALGAFVLERADAKARCLSDLEAWFADNPPYRGLAYASGIEMASRVISILFIVTCIGNDSIPASLAASIWTALVVHGRWIARFPSLYSSANNHLVAECVALFVLGTVIPDMRESNRWMRISWARLVTQADRLVHTDGAGAEQSPTYLAYTMEWFLLARVVCSTNQQCDTTELDPALERGARFLSQISDVAGNIPNIGDCDNSSVLRPFTKEPNYHASVVAATATVLQNDGIVHPGFSADVRSQLFHNQPLPGSRLPLSSAVFSDGGYTVMRSSRGDREIFVLFDHGSLGFAHTAAHGHADALSLWMHIDGEPVLTDFGTYRYNADGGWRDWARSTAAHNTIELNGESQSEITGPFNWGQRANSELLEHDVCGRRKFCRASHDAYAERDGVTHHREVSLEEPGLVVVADVLSGSGTHFVCLNFHFSPKIELRVKTDQCFSLYCEGKLISELVVDCADMASVITRQADRFEPGPGAVSSAYNKLEAAPTLTISGQIELPRKCNVLFKIMGRDPK